MNMNRYQRGMMQLIGTCIVRNAVRAVVMGMTAGLVSLANGGDRARMVSSGQEILDHWNPDQHLYVKGDIRVGRSSLDELERWLDGNGKNWTVVLMEHASGEKWKDIRGVGYYGMDAVENLLGRGLTHKTGFTALKDVRAGQPNGAIFVVFLRERKFAYFGSDVFDQRGLGESAWAGNLDGPARIAMRSGGRVISAVRNTVTHIEGRLTRRIAHEERLRREARERGERLGRMTRREIADVRRKLGELEVEAGKFRTMPVARGGDLANPSLAEWARSLDAAGDALMSGHAELALGSVTRVRGEVRRHHDAIQRWYHDKSQLVALGKRIEEVKLVEEYSDGGQVLEKAREQYERALAEHGQGKSGYAQRMGGITEILNRLEIANVHAVRERVQREQRERERAEKVRSLAKVGGLVVVLKLCLAGWYTNRRRRKLMENAQETLQLWREQTSDRFNRLFEVMDRAGVVVGSEKDLPERGYEGETLRESVAAIRAVDKAFILSAGVDEVMGSAEELIHPKWFWGKLVNTFSRLRYERALEMMERKPVPAGRGRVKVGDRRDDFC